MHHLAKFRQYRLNHGRDMAIFQFFEMAAAANLDFLNLKFLTVGTLKRVELHHRTKFCRNRSNRGWDITIFRFLQDGGRPPSWIFKSSKFQMLVWFGGTMCVIMPNVMPIGQTVAEISLFLDFSGCSLSYLGFFLISNFNGRNDHKCRTASLYQISSKSLEPYGMDWKFLKIITFIQKCLRNFIFDTAHQFQRSHVHTTQRWRDGHIQTWQSEIRQVSVYSWVTATARLCDLNDPSAFISTTTHRDGGCGWTVQSIRERGRGRRRLAAAAESRCVTSWFI